MISEAFEKGEVSYSKVRALTRIADEQNEADLLAIAKAGTASHVEKLVRGYRRADPKAVASVPQRASAKAMRRPPSPVAERRERGVLNQAHAQKEGRFLLAYYDEQGMLVLKGKLPPEAGAKVLAALELAEDELFRQENSETEERPSAAQRRADSLGLLAGSILEQGIGESSDRAAVIVHVDADVLRDEYADGMCELERGPNVPAETARRLSCDCSVVKVTHGQTADGSPTLNVGRKARSISFALRRALQVRDGTCQFPGCDHDRFLQGHHIRHWARGGETSLENTILLCARCHGKGSRPISGPFGRSYRCAKHHRPAGRSAGTTLRQRLQKAPCETSVRIYLAA